MQAALFLREKQELRKKKLKIRRGRYELPSHVATRDIAPFPRFPPNSWVCPIKLVIVLFSFFFFSNKKNQTKKKLKKKKKKI